MKNIKNTRKTTVININKNDLKPFNEIRAKETGRIKKIISQNTFVNFLIELCRQAEGSQKDAAWKKLEKKEG
ncbi:MAG: hypothetical protein PHZ02_01240 [Desulfocapsaceae bacterium]|nr:hypothetical protein [Desulfocapsaceae bacterium]